MFFELLSLILVIYIYQILDIIKIIIHYY